MDSEEDIFRLLSEYGEEEDTYECEPESTVKPLNCVDKKTVELLQHQIKNKLSCKSTESTADIINNTAGVDFILPENIKKMKRRIEIIRTYEYIVFCECGNLVKDSDQCTACKRPAKKNVKSNNFMVSFPIIPQIKSTLTTHYESIMQHLERKHDDGIMSDIDDGTAFKRISNEHPNKYILGCTVNVDGATIFRSSKGSLWIAQAYQNFLPPDIRYRPENILILSLYYGVKKPDAFHMMSFLAKELNEAEICVFDGNQLQTFIPAIITISCDLPARNMMQNMKGPVGKTSCPVCYHPGEPVKNYKGTTTIRYVRMENLKLRTHEETVMKGNLISAENMNGMDSIDGVKGLSCMILFNNFDIIQNFASDFMHGILLGIVKHLIEIWLGIKKIPDPANGLKIKLKNNEERICLNRCILGLKPLMHFKRKPRPIFDVAIFKATELLNLLLYYLRFALSGLLPTSIIKHFELLSAATYILCQAKIKDIELQKASTMLNMFASQFEDIYGKGAITMNVHLMHHYGFMIQSCGPIWCNSLFAFEANIGVIKGYISGKSNVLCQIAEKYSISKNMSIDIKDIDTAQTKESIHQQKTIELTEQCKCVLERNGFAMSQQNLNVSRRLKMNGHTYTSLLSEGTKSADYFLQMKNDLLGTAEFYFKVNETCFVYLNIYEVDYKHFHLHEVKRTNSTGVFPCKNIKRKLIYLKVNSIEFISEEPQSHYFMS